MTYRKPNEELEPECLEGTTKSGRTSTMIWGGIAVDQKSDLTIFVAKKVNAMVLVDEAYEGSLLGMLTNMDGPILAEDNAPIHRSKIATAWRDGHRLEKLEWPAQSPDLNPIENIWAQVKDRVQKKKGSINSVQTLKGAIVEAWDEIGMDHINALILDMPKRLREVIKRKGGSTHY